jgi:ribonuclease T2
MKYCMGAGMWAVMLCAWLSWGLAAAPARAEESEEAAGDAATVMVLGLSWQPGFCEGRPKTPECHDQTAGRIDARQLSLTGLWRLHKTYCGVAEALKSQDKQHKWLDMPELVLADALKADLARAMPGTLSGLDRHEWVKHGTCSGDVAATYYSRSLKMLAAVNGSAVGQLFAERGGKLLKADDLRAAFDSAFGPGAGDRIKLRCRKDGSRQVITGITIGLGADGGDDLAARIASAGKTAVGCAEGVVDQAGLQ